MSKVKQLTALQIKRMIRERAALDKRLNEYRDHRKNLTAFIKWLKAASQHKYGPDGSAALDRWSTSPDLSEKYITGPGQGVVDQLKGDVNDLLVAIEWVNEADRYHFVKDMEHAMVADCSTRDTRRDTSRRG